VSWFQGTPTEFCYSWILPLYFRASVPLLWVCLAHVPGSPRTGWRPPWVGGGVNTCMCLRGAAGFLRPGRLQPVRGGATPAERPFPRSEQRRRKIGGDLAPPPERSQRMAWNRWAPLLASPCHFSHPTPLHCGARTLGGEGASPAPPQVPHSGQGAVGVGRGECEEEAVALVAKMSHCLLGCHVWIFEGGLLSVLSPGRAQTLRFE
jgi:hypothetical protein